MVSAGTAKDAAEALLISACNSKEFRSPRRCRLQVIACKWSCDVGTMSAHRSVRQTGLSIGQLPQLAGGRQRKRSRLSRYGRWLLGASFPHSWR